MPHPIVIDKPLARRFLLVHLHLLPPRKLHGKQGVGPTFPPVPYLDWSLCFARDDRVPGTVAGKCPVFKPRETFVVESKSPKTDKERWPPIAAGAHSSLFHSIALAFPYHRAFGNLRLEPIR
jgi:hypothetical protein